MSFLQAAQQLYKVIQPQVPDVEIMDAGALLPAVVGGTQPAVRRHFLCRGGGGGISDRIFRAADIVEIPDGEFFREFLQLLADLGGGVGGGRRGEGAEGGNQVQAFAQADIDRLHAAHGQARHGPVLPVGVRIVVGIEVGDQVVAQLLAEGVEGLHVAEVRVGIVLRGAAVGHDDEQVLHIAFVKQVVRDGFELVAVRLGPFPFRAAHAVAEDQHITGDVLRVVRGEVDEGGLFHLCAVTVIVLRGVGDPLNAAAVFHFLQVFLRNDILKHVTFSFFAGGFSRRGASRGQHKDGQQQRCRPPDKARELLHRLISPKLSFYFSAAASCL